MTKTERREKRQLIIKYLEYHKILRSETKSIYDMIDREIFEFYNQLEKL